MATIEQVREMNEHRRDFALRSMLEAMESAAKTLERSAQEVRGYAQRAQEMHDHPDKEYTTNAADVATWAINSAVSYAPNNMRIDLIAKYAAEYAAASARLEKGN